MGQSDSSFCRAKKVSHGLKHTKQYFSVRSFWKCKLSMHHYLNDKFDSLSPLCCLASTTMNSVKKMGCSFSAFQCILTIMWKLQTRQEQGIHFLIYGISISTKQQKNITFRTTCCPLQASLLLHWNEGCLSKYQRKKVIQSPILGPKHSSNKNVLLCCLTQTLNIFH